MNELIFTLDKKDKDSLGNIRHIKELKVAADENYFWVRGLYDMAEADKSIRHLPLLHNFYLDENNFLFSPGSLTPGALLPTLSWLPIAEFITVEIPVAALPGQLDELAAIRLVTSTVEKKGKALLTTLEQWKTYAEYAPAIRLEQLQFAVSQKNEVLITGSPLPAIPGKEYWMMDNILVPAGYDFEIKMSGTFISKKLNPQKDGFVVFNIDGTYEKIDSVYLVAAKRSAVRLTPLIAKP